MGRLVTFTLTVFALTSCATFSDSAYYNKQRNVSCPNIVEKEFECAVDVAQYRGKYNLHKEYEQQLLSIHQRNEIIELEIEELRNKQK